MRVRAQSFQPQHPVSPCFFADNVCGVARPAAIGACDPHAPSFLHILPRALLGISSSHRSCGVWRCGVYRAGGAPFSGLLERFRKDHHTPDTAFSEHCSMFSVTMPDGEQTGPPVAMQRGGSQARSWLHTNPEVFSLSWLLCLPGHFWGALEHSWAPAHPRSIL